jgi:hypothetical protein
VDHFRYSSCPHMRAEIRMNIVCCWQISARMKRFLFYFCSQLISILIQILIFFPSSFSSFFDFIVPFHFLTQTKGLFYYISMSEVLKLIFNFCFVSYSSFDTVGILIAAFIFYYITIYVKVHKKMFSDYDCLHLLLHNSFSWFFEGWKLWFWCNGVLSILCYYWQLQ